MFMLTSFIKGHPKAALLVLACGVAWTIKPSAIAKAGEHILGAAIRLGFELFDADDMLSGIG
jgi:hypothetical protein